MKIKELTPEGYHIRSLYFFCPGCKELHQYLLPPWTFNEDFERPTFRQSLLHMRSKSEGRGPRCHLFVTDGRIEYCSDCEHELAGQTVDMPDLPEWAL